MRFIYLLLFLSPLPFASARPVWQNMWVIFIGLSGLVYTVRGKSLNTVKLPKAFYVPVGAVIFLVLWGTLQVLMGWSVTPEHTIGTTLYFFSHLVWFFLIFKSFQQRADVSQFVLISGLIASIYCVYGLIVYFSGNDTLLWYKKWASHGALTSTFVNRNSFATYTGLGFQCMLAYTLWALSHKFGEGRPFHRSLVQFFDRTLSILLLSLLVLSTSLLLTQSRAGILSSFIAAFSFTFIFLFKRYPTEIGKSIGTKTLFAFSILIYVLIFDLSGDMFEKRMTDLSTENSRFLIYPLIVQAIMEKPITGTGLGTFSEVFAQYRTTDLPLSVYKGHNDVLEIYMTGGIIVGTIVVFLFLFMVIFYFRESLKSTRYYFFPLLLFTLSLQIGLHSIVDFSLQIPAISYMYVGLCAAGAYIAAERRNST